jgi:hypothetical protein
MCRAAILNPRFPGSFLARYILACADTCQYVVIVLGNSVRDKNGDIAFLAETVLLVVPLLVIGGKLLCTTFAYVLAELAPAPAHLEEPCGRW